MQFAAAAGVHALPAGHDRLAAGLLVASGWLNLTPYISRAVGVNAFALTGGAVQRAAALVSLAGTFALTGGWIALLASWVAR